MRQLATLTLATFLLHPCPALAEGPQEVVVENFPPVQKVAGEVSIPEPVPHARLIRRQGVIVPPTERGETARLVEAGTVEALGFTGAVLSLQGELKGSLAAEGRIGAILLPDEGPFRRALNEEQRILLPLEVIAVQSSGEPFFSATGPSQQVAFGRYRVLLYNETSRSAEVNLYVYLTH